MPEIPRSREPAGIRSERPVNESKTSSLTTAETLPGVSELTVDVRTAGMRDPADKVKGEGELLDVRRDGRVGARGLRSAGDGGAAA